jgi:uncharacterized protein YgiB involved in biofilm formation
MWQAKSATDLAELTDTAIASWVWTATAGTSFYA